MSNLIFNLFKKNFKYIFNREMFFNQIQSYKEFFNRNFNQRPDISCKSTILKLRRAQFL